MFRRGPGRGRIRCEALTLGLGGLLVALTLALPAFRETADGDRLARSDLAVTFQDRYGLEVGKRGVNRDEAVPFEELPDYFVKALIATEDRRFFSHFGIDVIGTFRALTVDARGGRGRAGRLVDHPAARQEHLPQQRTVDRAQDQGGLPRALARVPYVQEGDPQAVSRPRLHGRRRLRGEAAAQTYFGKSARDIDLAEAAMLAGLFKAPTKFSPLVNLARPAPAPTTS